MDLTELRSIQKRERDRDELTELPENFYADVRDYLSELRQQRRQSMEATDASYTSPQVRDLTHRLETAEQVTEMILERRVGKIMKLSRTRRDPEMVGELTDSERELFATVKTELEAHRSSVLGEIVDE